MKKKVILFVSIVVVIVALFFTMKLATYDNSQSQCEHYQDSKRQQENIDNHFNKE